MNIRNALTISALAVILAACGSSNSSSPSLPATAAPTASLSIDKAAVSRGDAATLSWTSTDATTCQASDGWSGELPTSGTQSTGALTAPATFSIACSSGSGSSTTSSVTVNIAPSATLTATPTSVVTGGSVQLDWTSTDATACTASGNWSGALAASGSQNAGPLTGSGTFTLICTGPGGDSPPASATVMVTEPPPAPTATLSAAPSSIVTGGTSTLTWSSTGATACAADDGWSGAQDTAGTLTTPALTSTTNFTLTCTGPGGTSAPATVTVTVTPAPAPSVSLTATPDRIASGAAGTLTWSSSNATDCTASGGWSGAKAISGSASTGALTADASYILTCTGSGGSGSATATVSISSSLTPGTVALVTGQGQAFTQGVGSHAAFSVDGIAGGNASVGTISGAGLYTAGSATGAHTIRAADPGNAAINQTARAIVSDLTAISTYHGNNARDGANTQEYALTTGSVNTASFGKLASCTVDGVVAAQPLWVAQVAIGGAKHNVVYVATLHNGLYAIDADAAPCAILWQANLSDTSHGAAAGETPVPYILVGYAVGDIQPEIGIVGTPVIDVAGQTLYVISKSTNVNGTAQFSRLHAIDIATGNEKPGSPVTLEGTVSGTAAGGSTVTFDSTYQLQRAGLALAGNTVYVAFSSHEDKDPWFGWTFAYQYANGAFTRSALFNTAPDGGRAGIWMSGGAPAIDSASNVYLTTGNGPFNASDPAAPNRDFGDSLLKLTPGLSVTEYWTPATQASDAAADRDFGAGGASMLADMPAGASYLHVLVCGGKTSTLEVLNRDMLGGYTGPVVQEINLQHNLFSTPAFWNNRLFLATAGSHLETYTLNTSTVQLAKTALSNTVFSWPGATPAVSASGQSNGIVWAMEQNAFCTHNAQSCGPAVLHAYDATNIATELWSSGTQAGDAAGNAVKFTTPTVANGHVYVGTRGNNTGTTSSVPGTLEIYGLKP